MSWSRSTAWVRRNRLARRHDAGVSKRAEYLFALYSGSLAEPGDRNPYSCGEPLILAKLWMHGYIRMLRVRIETGPAMQAYLGARKPRADQQDRAQLSDGRPCL